MEINKDEKYLHLDYYHDEIEALLDKINEGYVLSKEQYDKLTKVFDPDTVIGFSGDYNDLINKPDIVEEIRKSLTELKIETSETVDQKLDSLQDSIEESIQQTAAGKSDLGHGHDILEIKDLQSILNSKAEFLHNHDEAYPTFEFLQEKLKELEVIAGVDLSNYITKDLLQEALNNKANKAHIHSMNDISDLNDTLSLKADVDQVYDKWTIDQMMSEHDHNDIYYSKEEVNNNFATVEDLLSVIEDLATKADYDHAHNDIYYTKQEVEEKIEEGLETIDLTDYVKQEEMSAALSSKADIDHRHDSDYAAIEHEHSVKDIEDIEDFYYDKETVNTMLDAKSDIGHNHDMSEINNLQEELDKKANKEDVYTKEEVNQQLDSKADIDHRHDEIYYTKEEVEEKIDEKLEPYATIEYVDTGLAQKADAEHGHDISAIEGLQDELDSKANSEDVYTKDKIDVMVDDLNTKIDSKADVDHKHDEYADKEHDHVVEEVTDLFEHVYDKTQTDELLAGKSDIDHKHDEYAEKEHEHTIEDITDLLDNFYTEDETDEFLTGKSDIDHRHDEDYAPIDHKHDMEDIEGIDDAFYTKDEMDTLLSGKSDIDHHHDDVYAAKVHEHTAKDITDLYDNIYNKTEVDDALVSKSDVGHGHEIVDVNNLQEELDKKINKDIAATKEELENGLNGKSDLDHKHDEVYAQIVHEHNDLYYTEDEIGVLLDKAKDEARVAAVTEANAYTVSEIANLVDSAPEAMNTLNELAQAIEEHQDVYEAYVETVSTALAGKADYEHNHDGIYYTKDEIDNKVSGDLTTTLAAYAKVEDVQEALNGKADLEHPHICADITDLQDILDAKADSINAATKEEFDALKDTVDAKAEAVHKHDMSEVEDLQETLNAKIDKSEAATKEALESALAGKADYSHDHNGIYYTKEEIDTNISGKIDGIDFSKYAKVEDLATKADAEHVHDMSEITDLQKTLESKLDVSVGATKEELATKAEAEHGHDISEIKDLQKELDIRTANSYSKEEMDALLALKLSLDAVSTLLYYKDEIDALLELKLNVSDVDIITNEIIDSIVFNVFSTDI